MSKKAFSLVEVLVSTVIIAAISSAAWLSVGVLFKSHEMTRNRVLAVNLLRKSQEEVRRVAQFKFDDLESCNFDIPSHDTCNFEDTQTDFPKVERHLDVDAENNSSEIKRSHVWVIWDELGTPQRLDSVMLVARPAQELPGNLIGRVYDVTNPSTIIQGAIIKMASGTNTSTTNSKELTTRTDGTQLNYTFEDKSGRYQLAPANNWKLTATHDSYVPYVNPDEDITIESGSESTKDIAMTLRPTPGHIRARLIENGTPNAIALNSSSDLRLLDNNNFVAPSPIAGATGTNDFTINFDTPDKKCFTVATENTYKSEFVGNAGCPQNDPLIHYHYRGWSSSVFDDGGAVNCGKPWFGTDANDRVCVTPGQTVDINVPLVRVPTATVKGIVKDKQGNPIKDAEILVSWHDNTLWKTQPQAITNEKGEYSVLVPAEQELFPNQQFYYLNMIARARAPITRCCDTPGNTLVSTPNLKIGPLTKDKTFPQDFLVPIDPIVMKCGDVSGLVFDDSNGNSLNGATISVGGLTRTSSGGGNYVFNCSPKTGKCIQAGQYFALATNRPNYYDYDTSGTIYIRKDPITIVDKQDVVAPPIRMLPIGRGIINGTVHDAGTNGPIGGVKITISGNNQTYPPATTQPDGTFTISSIQESWPPPGVVGNPKYAQTVRQYHLNAHAGDFYKDYDQNSIQINKGQTLTINIKLFPNGNM